MAKVCCSKSFHKHVPQPLAPDSSQLPLQSGSNITKGIIKAITCTNTEKQLSLSHIKHVTIDDAAPTIHIHVTSLNGLCDIEMLLDLVLIYHQQIESS